MQDFLVLSAAVCVADIVVGFVEVEAVSVVVSVAVSAVVSRVRPVQAEISPVRTYMQTIPALIRLELL